MSGKSRGPSKRRQNAPARTRDLDGQAAPSIEISQQLAGIQFRQGPIPDAMEMTRYNQINNELPTRIMAMAEAQSDHRMALEHSALQAEVDDRSAGWIERRLGQVFGMVIALAGIIAGSTVAIMNPTAAGGAAGAAIAGLPLVFMVRVMVLGRRENNKK